LGGGAIPTSGDETRDERRETRDETSGERERERRRGKRRDWVQVKEGPSGIHFIRLSYSK
jgi:hypothetical protein